MKLFLLVHSSFVVFSQIIAFKQTQTRLLTAFNLFFLLQLYNLHLLNAFAILIFETGIRIATFSHRVSARWETNGAHYPVKTWRDHLEFRVHDNNRADTTSGVRAEWIGVGTLDVSFEDGRKSTCKYSKQRRSCVVCNYR